MNITNSERAQSEPLPENNMRTYGGRTAAKFCAHRGVSALMPENTLPAFAAALALGADEIEFDVRITKDKKIIVSHDNNLERISDAKGMLADYTLAELKKVNIGIKHGWQVGFCTAEEIFEQFANRFTFNIHVKEAGDGGWLISELRDMITSYNSSASCYFAGVAGELEWMVKNAPDIRRVAIQLPSNADVIFDLTQRYDCVGVQFWHGLFDEELVMKMHEHNIFCNNFFADTYDDYTKYFGMGIDTLLTNRMDLANKYRYDLSD